VAESITPEPIQEPVSVDDNSSSLTVDNAGLTELATAIDTELQVDVVGALPAGTNNIGDVDVASIAAGDNNIGNVDVVTLPALPAGTNNIGDVDVLSSALPSGASTLLEQQSQTTALQIMDDWDESDRAKVNPIAGQAGIAGGTGVDGATVPRVTLATNVALPTGANAIGKLAANSGIDIGDVDVTSVVPGTGATNLGKAEDAQHTTGDVGVMPLAVRSAAPSERSAGPTDGDYEPLATNEVGGLWTTTTPSANGGASTMNATSSDGGTALTSTAQAIKGGVGCVYGYFIYNPNATAQFVQFYNTAQGSVTVGTTNPLFMLTIPATSAANLWTDTGIQFSSAISWAATSTAGGNGAPGTALDAVCWFK
jgi:hypothetical protein